MKTNVLHKANRLMTTLAGMMVVVLATQSVVSTVSAQAMMTNDQNQAAALTSKITDEINRRQELLNTVTANSTATGTDSTKTGGASSINAGDCPDVSQSIIKQTNTETSSAQSKLTAFQDSLKKSTDLAGAKQQATSADSSYEDFQKTATKAGIVTDLCQQGDTKAQLNSLIEQAKTLASSQSSGSNNGGGGGSGGGSGGDSKSGDGDVTKQITEEITAIVQLVAAVTAIGVSVAALITALQNGDYAAAMTIFTTILGQLAIASSVLTQAISGISSIIEQLGGSINIQVGATS